MRGREGRPVEPLEVLRDLEGFRGHVEKEVVGVGHSVPFVLLQLLDVLELSTHQCFFLFLQVFYLGIKARGARHGLFPGGHLFPPFLLYPAELGFGESQLTRQPPTGTLGARIRVRAYFTLLITTTTVLATAHDFVGTGTI